MAAPTASGAVDPGESARGTSDGLRAPCPSCLSTATQLTAAHALIAQWRKVVDTLREAQTRHMGVPSPEDIEQAARLGHRIVFTRCADQLEVLLTPQEQV